MRKIVFKKYRKIIWFSIIMFVIAIAFILCGDKLVKDKHYIRLDKSEAPNEFLINQHISKEMPYLPIVDLAKRSNHNRNLNSSCAWYPWLSDILIHNNYWQVMHNNNITYFIYGAYLDNRPTVVSDKPVVRLLTMMNFLKPKDEDYPLAYCQFWYAHQAQPIIMPTTRIHRLWVYEWSHNPQHNHGHLITCPLPNEQKDWIPQSVSLVAQPCDKATNNVRLYYMPLKANEVKQRFIVCLKGMDYPYKDYSHRLVEYVETLRSLGAGKIVIYNYQIHPNMTKVLQYYEQTGFVEYLPFTMSLEVGNLPEYGHMEMTESTGPLIKHEVIPYNDCLYRYMYRYDYVANVDMDEILMPLGNFSNWHDLMEFAPKLSEGNCKKFGSFCFRCIYFPRYPEKPRYTDDIPEYFYMLQHVERVRDHIRPDWATKCFHSTAHTIGTHNHFPMHWTADVCPSYSFNATHAQMNHYREPDIKETLNDPVIDKSLWRFKDEIIERSLKVFEDMDFF